LPTREPGFGVATNKACVDPGVALGDATIATVMLNRLEHPAAAANVTGSSYLPGDKGGLGPVASPNMESARPPRPAAAQPGD
jgi:hypothetical protein